LRKLQVDVGALKLVIPIQPIYNPSSTSKDTVRIEEIRDTEQARDKDVDSEQEDAEDKEEQSETEDSEETDDAPEHTLRKQLVRSITGNGNNYKPYACDACGKGFAYPHTLKYHKAHSCKETRQGNGLLQGNGLVQGKGLVQGSGLLQGNGLVQGNI